MKFICLTLFPEQIKNFINYSLIKKAILSNKVSVQAINIRSHPREKVDDYAFGGGGGMVLMAQPIIDRLIENNLLKEHIILLHPRGKMFSHQKAQELLSINKKIIFICGHYEGVDERINRYISEEISIGDYVLTCGELSALVIIDSVFRLIPNIINRNSLISESFNNYLLDYPCYTRPSDLSGDLVPEILLSGNHKEIDKYRLEERIRLTKKLRPDMYKKYIENF